MYAYTGKEDSIRIIAETGRYRRCKGMFLEKQSFDNTGTLAGPFRTLPGTFSTHFTFKEVKKKTFY